MKLIFEFYFNNEKNKYLPTCYSDERNEFNPLTGYLTDDIGGDYIDFLESSIETLRDNIDIDISSNSWGCDVDEKRIFLYFLYDYDNQDYHLYLDKDVFYFILSEWLSFIKDKSFQTKREIVF